MEGSDINFSNIIEKLMPGERGETFLKANSILEAKGITSHYIELDNLLAIEDTVDNLTLIQNLEKITMEKILEVVSEMGIGLNNISLSRAVEFLETVDNLTYFEDPQSIMDIVEEGSNEKEILGEVLLLINGYGWDEYILAEILDFVSLTTINNLKEFMLGRIETVIEEMELEESNRDLLIRERLFNFLEQFPSDKMSKLFEDGYQVSYKVLTYLNAVYGEDSEEIVESNLKEFVVFYVASILAAGHPISIASKYAGLVFERFIVEDLLLSKAVMEVDNIIGGYSEKV